MTIVINDPEVEAMLRRMAEQRGLTPEALVAELARRTEEQVAYDAWARDFWASLGKEPPEQSEPLPQSFYDNLSA